LNHLASRRAISSFDRPCLRRAVMALRRCARSSASLALQYGSRPAPASVRLLYEVERATSSLSATACTGAVRIGRGPPQQRFLCPRGRECVLFRFRPRGSSIQAGARPRGSAPRMGAPCAPDHLVIDPDRFPANLGIRHLRIDSRLSREMPCFRERTRPICPAAEFPPPAGPSPPPIIAGDAARGAHLGALNLLRYSRPPRP
jgi:hypothetical protein